MGLILDTNALSSLWMANRSLLPLLQKTTELSLPAIVLGEYLYGVRQSRMRKRYEQWLNSNLVFFRILVVGTKTAHHCADIRQKLKAAGSPIPTNDLWIAAIAREHKLPLVTKNRHFDTVTGVKTLAW